MNILIPYLHYIGIMIIMGAFITEHVILKPGIRKPEINSLVIIDLIYGISAGLVLVTGLLRWFVVDVKGIEFFSKNPLFHIKLTLFVVIIILSIFPTMKFLKWKKQARHDDGYVPNKKEIKQQLIFIRIELLLMAIIPLLAVMIAKGGRI